ncbi:MAG: hypothetical protein A3D31_00480 [Candidatus Fluviicola riflensis]|nr:MAG: hypothetical protein CHH17_05065 [Candidatus Fluviicola riflensis]OGS76083.1 MAG: hypothetical protein A3D31_00480 [Candidatus Fluviicola riflensis]OGS81983.1 MAG: hypothetical protein A2724_16235 [Fluviicola sp. RIFCSPHIGHO2_01_FULL_43_53]OGS83421.1 MAG: hypothetical protein A3E30_19400 [Fluviicola sp. RIFCSPHIGHO2_12_FULL_43_24]
MQFYYITQVGKLIEEVSKRYSFYLLFFIGLTGQTAFGQTAPTMVDQLLAERSSRIAQSVPTRDIDLQLLELGHRPKAIVSTQTLENGSIRLSFPIYRPMVNADAQKVEARLSQNYIYMTSIDVNSDLQEVTLQLNAGVSIEEIDAIVRHFGYLGHE